MTCEVEGDYVGLVDEMKETLPTYTQAGSPATPARSGRGSRTRQAGGILFALARGRLLLAKCVMAGCGTAYPSRRVVSGK